MLLRVAAVSTAVVDISKGFTVICSSLREEI